MKTYLIGNFTLQSILTVCITVAAIYFKNPWILFFYIMPCFFGLVGSSEEKKKNDKK